MVVIGDSHARVLSESLFDKSRLRGLGFVELTSSGCPFLIGLTVFADREITECTADYQARRLAVLKSLPPSTVVLHSRLPLYIYGDGFDNERGGIEVRQPYFASTSPISSLEQRVSEIRSSFKSTLAAVISAGHTVIVVDPVPTNGWDPVQRLRRIDATGMAKTFEQRVALMSIPLQAVTKRHLLAKQIISGAVESFESKRVSRVDPIGIFCETSITKQCLSFDEKTLLYADRDHLSSEGADRLSVRIMSADSH